MSEPTLDLDAPCCPWCLAGLVLRERTGEDGRVAKGELNLWPDGFWGLTCGVCGCDADDSDGDPYPTLRNNLPAPVVAFIEFHQR